MLRIHEIKLNLKENIEMIPVKIQKKLHLKDGAILNWRIVRESVDARKKPDLKRIYTVDFEVQNEADILKNNKNVTPTDAGKQGVRLRDEGLFGNDRGEGTNPGAMRDPFGGKAADRQTSKTKNHLRSRPVVIGFGPCGMFAALSLAENGYRPVIIERGCRMENRIKDVERFWAEGKLSPRSNVQFGEGGAGAFSDGKLNSGIKNSYRTTRVLETFVELGAPQEILYKQNPHVGTDILRNVVVAMREKILKLGGEILFDTCLTGIKQKEGKLCGILLKAENGERTLDTEALILAPGHSARDTFRVLYDQGLEMEAKAFSIGVRIEHAQEMINLSQYGSKEAAEVLGAADYRLSYRCKNGRGVYTFCMCPGGYVVASASEEGGVVTNGMSYHGRDGVNANSALLVGVESGDFSSEHPLAGVEFQRKWEQAAFKAGGSNYFAPVQKTGDFMKGIPSSGAGSVNPEYKPGVTWTDVSQCLPDFAVDAMREAIPALGRKLKGFDMEDGVMTAVETRSSSPVRIKRGEDTQSCLEGLFPAGEGAGYAGGIMSAAVDGIKAAEKLMDLWSPLNEQEK